MSQYRIHVEFQIDPMTRREFVSEVTRYTNMNDAVIDVEGMNQAWGYLGIRFRVEPYFPPVPVVQWKQEPFDRYARRRLHDFRRFVEDLRWNWRRELARRIDPRHDDYEERYDY